MEHVLYHQPEAILERLLLDFFASLQKWIASCGMFEIILWCDNSNFLNTEADVGWSGSVWSWQSRGHFAQCWGWICAAVLFSSYEVVQVVNLGLKQFISLLFAVGFVFVTSHDICCSKVKLEIKIRQSESQKYTLKPDPTLLAHFSNEAFGLLHVHEIKGDATLGKRPAQQSSARGRRCSTGKFGRNLSDVFPHFPKDFPGFFSINSVGCYHTTLLRHCQRRWEVVESAPARRCAGAKTFHVSCPSGPFVLGVDFQVCCKMLV